MRTFRLLAALALLLVSLAGGARCETVGPASTAATTGTTPHGRKAAPRVLLRAGAGPWQEATAETREGRLVFTLDPAKLRSGDITLLINPPAAMVVDDFAGPQVVALEADGRPLPAAGQFNLGTVLQPPSRFNVTFRDQCNALAPEGYRLLVDGQAVAVPPAWLSHQGEKQVTVGVRLPRFDYGRHEISLTATDASPQANATTGVLRFDYLETGNVAAAAMGAQAAVDSHFSGYESLAALNDGVTTMPGDHCGNDLSWASAEVATDHWAQITFPRPTPIAEVTVHWAAYTNISHTPRHFEIQVPEGQGWKTVYASPAEGEKIAPLTTARFAPLTTRSFRVFMPKSKGPPGRPNLLWIGEVKAR